MPTEADTIRNASWLVSCDRRPAGLSSGEAGRHETRNREGPEMRRPMTDRINDDSWAMGVLEPILLLLAIAVIAALVGLF